MADKRGKAAFFSDDDFEVKEETQENNTIQIHNTDTQQTYTMPQEETRSKRIQIVIKPSVNKALDKLVKQKKIKSKNDLVNFLLEQFIEQNQ